MKDIVQSMFGPTPYQIQQQQYADQEAMHDRAAANAGQSPGQMMARAYSQMGSALGGGAANMMGMVNPQVEEAKQNEGIQSQIDHNSADGLRQGAIMFNEARNPRMAYMYEQAAQTKEAEASKMALEGAQTQSALNKANSEASPLAKIPFEKATKESRIKYMQTKNIGDLEFTDTADKISAWGQQLVDAGYTPGTPEFNAEMRKRLAADLQGSASRGANLTVNLPKQGGGIIDVVAAFDKAVEVPKSTNESAKLAKRMINEASASNNTAAWEATRTVFARMIGEGKLSNEDIRRTGVDPRIVQGTLDWINKKVSGVPNQDIMKQLYAASSLIEKNSSAQIDQISGRMRNIAKSEGFKGNPDDFFPITGKQPAAAAGGWEVVR